MNKKGQSISINTIIVAAIALAVLVVLFMIFTGRLGLFTKGVGEATNCNQACASAGYKAENSLMATISDGGNTFSNCGSLISLPGYSVIDSDGKRKSCCCSN